MHSTKWHGFREVGNSVPPLLARKVAAQVIKALEVRPEKPEHSKINSLFSLVSAHQCE
jgi:DNA (cytosine-5)-methyltransferase 1